MAVQGLIILSGAIPGIRDITWVHDHDQNVIGYFVYRAESLGATWTKLTPYPIPGNYFRDMTTLETCTHEVVAQDWIERGEDGRWIFRLPEPPLYGDIISGRAILARESDVQVLIDGVPAFPARVDAFDGSVWLAHAYGLVKDKDRRERLLPLPGETQTVIATFKRLVNYVEPNPDVRAYYTVVPAYFGGAEQHLPGAPGTEVVNILEIDKMDYMQAEMVRRNAWIFEQVGEPSHLLIRRTRGEHCPCAREMGQPRTGCQICFETGIVGGYYGPFDLLFIDPDSGTTKELEEGGIKVTRESKSYLGPTPLLQGGDLIVRKNGERMVITTVVQKSPRGILLQQDYDVERLNGGDTRYRVPIRPPLNPEAYHPAFDEKPGIAGEPVSTPKDDPTKVWENPQVPIGRTTVFGNIQT